MEEQIQIPMQSESVGKLAEALSNFQGSVKQPKLNKSVTVKTNGGGSYKFQYADLGACISAAAPELQKNGLAVFQTIQGQVLVTTLAHSSGEFVTSQLPLHQGTLFSNAFQQIGSMITYLKRYAYCAILGIVADDDDDANAACANEYQYQTKEKPAQAQQKTGFTGAQLKKALEVIEEKQNADELRAFWTRSFEKYPELQQNKQFNDALFQKASKIACTELALCKNEDDILLLVDKWNDIWGAIVSPNTPFANAVNAKRQTLQQ